MSVPAQEVLEPQHIGVGMYQHDVNNKTLRESLDQVIESCVNYVGVELNSVNDNPLVDPDDGSVLFGASMPTPRP